LFAIVVGLLSSVLISGYAVRWARPYRPPMWEIVLLSMIVATLVAMVVTWFASGVCE
jgi:cation transporter-like permease